MKKIHFMPEKDGFIGRAARMDIDLKLSKIIRRVKTTVALYA